MATLRSIVLGLVSVLFLTNANICNGLLVLPKTPPRGFNSFDLQVYSRTNPAIYWNETTYRAYAQAMVDQGLLAKGYDTIVIDGGWSANDIDEYGRNIPDVTRWPSAANGQGFLPLARWTHSLGLKMGVWHIRGVVQQAVDSKLKIKGGNGTTIDQITWGANGPEQWKKCTWDQSFVGIDASQPEAQVFYNSVVEKYAEWELDLLKWDCLYDGKAGYSNEETLVVNAVKQSPREFVLSLSPGGGMKDKDADWIASGERASMYRITGDFHSSNKQGLVQHAFVAANLTKRFSGVKNTWPDHDMIDLGNLSPWHNTPTAVLHASIWMMAKSPLMYAGQLPADESTLNLIANPLALDINSFSSEMRTSYQGNCNCTKEEHPDSQWACLLDDFNGPNPCVAVWWSDMPNLHCRALAVLNLGNTTATNVKVSLSKMMVPASDSYNITNIYEHTSVVQSSDLVLTIPAQGAKLLMVTDPSVLNNAATCATTNI